MIKRIAHIVLFIALCFGTAEAQYITLPDKAFIQFLTDSFPTVLNTQKQLDTTKAKTISGKLFARNRSIADVSGIQYFTAISEIHLGKNKLTSFPRIDKLKSLKVLNLDTNQIKVLPDLRSLSSLTMLSVYNNRIDSLPDMTNMANLVHYLVVGNGIKKLPDLTGCTNLKHIVANDNKISQLPDFTKHLQLNRVLFANNQFKEVDFNLIPTVTEARFDGNLLTKFPDLKGRTNLTELQLDRNYIDSLPDLSSFVNLTILHLSANFFTFESLAKFNSVPLKASYSYSPQRLIGKADTVIKRQNTSFTLVWPVRNPLSSNQYTFYKDGKVIATGSVPNITIPKTSKNDQGTYSIECRNANYPQLVLKSNNVLLRIVDCFDLGQLKVNYEASSCKYPVAASVDENTIAFGRKPFSYKLRNVLSNEETKFNSSQLTITKEGTYDFVLSDSTGCEQVVKKFVQTSRPDNCDPIFYPGLNGPESTFYIDQKGIARIYNNAGHKLKELSVPAYWDGKDNNGQLLDSGLYLIIINEQIKIPISLMRVN